MQKQIHVHTPENTNGAGLHHAIDVVKSGAGKVATGTENIVRRFPLASAGVALGTGVAIGALAYHLLSPSAPRTLRERLAQRLSSLF